MAQARTAAGMIARLERNAADFRSVERVASLLGIDFTVRLTHNLIHSYSFSFSTYTSVLSDNRVPVLGHYRLTFNLSLNRQYPVVSPVIVTSPGCLVPFHPEFELLGYWRLRAQWCSRGWNAATSLGSHIEAMVRTLALDFAVVDFDGPNREAAEWLKESSRLIDIASSQPIKTRQHSNYLLPESSHQGSQTSFLPPEATETRNSPEQGRTRKRFAITEAHGRKQPLAVRGILVRGSLRPSSHQSGLFDTFSTILNQRAFQEIASHIEWGQRVHYNQVEQGGLLLGRVVRSNERTWVLVDKAVPAQNTQGSPGYLQINHSTWKTMLDSIDADVDPSDNKYLVGWYHTHPNSLDVFMSDTDRATQRKLFAENWHVAIVLNPHKQLWKAFHGPRATECQAFIASGHVDIDQSFSEINSDQRLLPQLHPREENAERLNKTVLATALSAISRILTRR